jgi:putative methylase
VRRLAVDVEFDVADATTYRTTCDTVVMNPPFGAQFAARHADVAFMEAAHACANVSYSLHMNATLDHLHRWAVRMGGDLRVLARYAFPLPAQFAFHQRERHDVDVCLVRIERS